MRRYILTGAPGAGKTTIIRTLDGMGRRVVEEAATDVNVAMLAAGVAEPWKEPSFIDDIVALQRRRQMEAQAPPDGIVFFDRSPVCTQALGVHLGRPISPALALEVARIDRERTYERTVFFIDNLGFVEPTAVRRISFEESLGFEAIHKTVYRSLGYDLVRIPADDLQARVDAILRRVAALA